MKDNRFDTKTDRIIQASMKLADEPAGELNRKLKEALYRKEKAMQNQPAMCRLSLWYLPMVFNLILSGMLAVTARMMIGNVYLFYFTAGICLYIGLSGVLLTVVGVKRANLKEDMTIHVEKRGAWA